MSKVMVIAAHPDDEVLGCGGTIARHVAEEDEVSVLILAEGVTSRDELRDRNQRSTELSALGEAAKRANLALGVERLELLNFPDNRMDSVDALDVVKEIEQHVAKWEPDIVYTHHPGDLNIDHRKVSNAVVTACRPVPGQSVQTLLFFEVPSSTEWNVPGYRSFDPNWYVDVSEFLEQKMAALREYEMEMRPWPHARSIESVQHLAGVRGASAGVAAAEAFSLSREFRFKIWDTGQRLTDGDE